MARISVVVPVYDVESYLPACLQSIARQEVDDLEVVVVDDGSRDGSAEIAATFARHDPRFRLIRQPNGGLGRARNAGLDAATGEYLAFADGDDVVPSGAYARLLGSLERTGSDLASGNVLRLNRQGTVPAQFLARTFARTRLRTHVTRFRPLLADRTAWNKLWRRAFWDAQRLRFPEGVVHEDIPVTLPAHLAAAKVDVLAAPVYHWRLREDGAPSITQRRLEHARAARPARGGPRGPRPLRGARPRSSCATGMPRASWPTTCACISTCSTKPTTSTGRCSSTARTTSSIASRRASSARSRRSTG